MDETRGICVHPQDRAGGTEEESDVTVQGFGSCELSQTKICYNGVGTQTCTIAAAVLKYTYERT